MLIINTITNNYSDMLLETVLYKTAVETLLLRKETPHNYQYNTHKTDLKTLNQLFINTLNYRIIVMSIN